MGLPGPEKPVLNSSWTRGMSEGRLPWTSSQFEEAGCEIQNPPDTHQHNSHLHSPPPRQYTHTHTRWGSFKAKGRKFWRKSWAMKCSPKLRNHLTQTRDQGTVCHMKPPSWPRRALMALFVTKATIPRILDYPGTVTCNVVLLIPFLSLGLKRDFKNVFLDRELILCRGEVTS